MLILQFREHLTDFTGKFLRFLHLHLPDLLGHSDCVTEFTRGSACLTGGFQVILQSIVAAGAYRGPDGDQFQCLFIQWHGYSFLRLYLTLFHQILHFYKYIAAVMAPR